MKDAQNKTIAVLVTLAVILSVAQLFVPQPARAEVARDREYQVVTARVTSGGDGLYIHDVKTGQIAIFTYDPGARQLKPRAVRMISDAFPAVTR